MTTYSEATIRALWIKETPVPTGGTSPFTVRVSASAGNDAAVGFIEHVIGSAGDAWKSSAWIAALAASNASNDLLTDHEFLLKVRGFIDGPSAGMVMAATMLALIRAEASIRPGVTISGTVNPDGTIGPVSGIEYKLDGAARVGIKELGYPMITEGDEAQFVREMEKLGAAKGIKMVPIADIYQAYDLLTGRTLGRPKEIDPAEMAPSPARNAWLNTATTSLLEEAATRLGSCEQRYSAMTSKLSARDKQDYAEDRALTQQYITQSEAAAKAGTFMLAHSQATLAEQSARVSEKKLEWQQSFLRRDAKALSAMYVAQYAAVEERLTTTLAALRATLTSPTVAGRMASFNNYLQYWSARAQFLAARSTREDIKRRQQILEQARAGKFKMSSAEQTKATDELGAVMLAATLRLALLEGRIRAISGFMGVHFDDSTLAAPDQTTLNQRLAAAYGPAAAAGLAYFETTVLGASRGDDTSTAEIRNSILATDQAFSACSMAAEFAVQHLDDRDQPDDSPEAVMDRLACGVVAYLSMAGLMNKYYNLAEYRPSGGSSRPASTVSIKHGETVARMIKSSRQRVLEEASRVMSQLKFIPDAVKMSFNLGESKQNDGSDTGKLDALISYWRAHFLCKMAQMVARGK
jgi:hypothetical protein